MSSHQLYSAPVGCFTYRGPDKTLESSNFVAFNPAGKPGCSVMAGSCAAHDSIGSQVACRLALEHFSSSLLTYFEEHEYPSTEPDFGLHALETAFRDANRNVYSFGHSLAAGGRTAAVFLALLYLQDSEGNGSFCAGRVGDGAAFLYRDGQLFPFFESLANGAESSGVGNYLGANSLVSVDLANVPLEYGDVVYVFSEPLDAMGEHELHALASEIQPGSSLNPAEELSRFLFDKPTSIGFTFSLSVGKPAIFLPAATRAPDLQSLSY